MLSISTKGQWDQGHSSMVSTFPGKTGSRSVPLLKLFFFFLMAFIFYIFVVTLQPHLKTVEWLPRSSTSKLFASDHIYDNPAFVSYFIIQFVVMFASFHVISTIYGLWWKCLKTAFSLGLKTMVNTYRGMNEWMNEWMNENVYSLKFTTFINENTVCHSFKCMVKLSIHVKQCK